MADVIILDEWRPGCSNCRYWSPPVTENGRIVRDSCCNYPKGYEVEIIGHTVTCLSFKRKRIKHSGGVTPSIPLRVTAEPEWPPLPSAPPQAAEDFDDLGPSSLPDVQDIPEASAAPGREAEYVRDWRGLLRTLSDKVMATCIHSPESGAEPAEAGEGGSSFRISGKDLSRMWHVLGRLQGVLEASAEAGKPGEVMKDACDELEVILCGIQQDAG